MSDEPTIFERIIGGEIPSHKVYEDDRVFAFLDINPLSRGHCLVVPKTPRAHLHELSDEDSEALGRVLPRLCRAVMKVSGAPDYNVLQNNGKRAHQAVFHVHFHIIPRFKDEGLGIQWSARALGDEDGKRLAEAIRQALAADST